MPYAAFLDPLRPGSRSDALAALAALGPADPPPPGLLSSAVFVRGDAVVRAALVDEGISDETAVLAADVRIREVARVLAPFTTAEPRQDLAAALRERQMRRVQQRVVRHTTDADMSALWYDVRPGFADRIEEVFTQVRPQRTPMLRDAHGATTGVLHGVAVFVAGAAMVRVVSYTGRVADVARYMATRPGRPEIDRQLAPWLVGSEDTASAEAFVAAFPGRLMTRAEPERAGR
jgi:hypothetical protein